MISQWLLLWLLDLGFCFTKAFSTPWLHFKNLLFYEFSFNICIVNLLIHLEFILCSFNFEMDGLLSQHHLLNDWLMFLPLLWTDPNIIIWKTLFLRLTQSNIPARLLWSSSFSSLTPVAVSIVKIQNVWMRKVNECQIALQCRLFQKKICFLFSCRL